MQNHTLGRSSQVQNMIQADDVSTDTSFECTFFCGNKCLACPGDLAFVPTGFVLKAEMTQTHVWDSTDPALRHLTRERAMSAYAKQLSKTKVEQARDLLANPARGTTGVALFVVDPALIDTMTATELRRQCVQRGAPAGGSRAALAERLRRLVESTNGPPSAASAPQTKTEAKRAMQAPGKKVGCLETGLCL